MTSGPPGERMRVNVNVEPTPIWLFTQVRRAQRAISRRLRGAQVKGPGTSGARSVAGAKRAPLVWLRAVGAYSVSRGTRESRGPASQYAHRPAATSAGFRVPTLLAAD